MGAQRPACVRACQPGGAGGVEAAAFRWLRRAEFLAALPTRLPRLLDVESQAGNAAAGACAVLWLLMMGAGLRCAPLHWREQSSPAALSVGLLWTLAGALPMLTALTAGWAWLRPVPRARARPLVHLLPLSASRVARAKLEGRLAALLLVCCLGFGLGALARGLMASSGPVDPPPALLDPWLPGSLLVFATCFVLSWRLDWGGRRGAPSCLTVLAALLLLTTVRFWGPPLLRHGPWDAVVLPAEALALALLLALVAWGEERLGRRSRQAVVVGSAAPAPAPPAAGEGAWQPLLPGQALARERRWAETVLASARALKAALALLLIPLAAEGLLALLEACFGYQETGHWGFRSQAAAALVALPSLPLWLALVTVLPLPMAVWSESPSQADAVEAAVRRRGFGATHLGHLLPVAARTLWRRRFYWTLGRLLQMGGAGLVACWLLGEINECLGLSEDLGLVENAPAAVVAVVSLVCGGFALPPLVRRATMVLAQSRVWAGLSVPGLVLAVAVAGVLWRALPLPSVLLATLLPAAVLLAVSWALTEPRAWPLLPDGRFATRSRWQASAVAVALPLLAAVAIAAAFGLLRYLHAL